MKRPLLVKYKELRAFLKQLHSAVAAFSGGLDSAFLVKVGFEALGNNLLAVTAASPTYPAADLEEAKRVAREIGIKHLVIRTGEFKDRNFLSNSRQRCYWCKRELFCKLKEIARRYNITYIIDGTNYDDRGDHRPGLKANREFAVVSPLYECRIKKSEIRALSKSLGCSFWNKPSGTCLSSRIPFGERITSERIKKIDAAEKILRNFLGRNVLVRARDHGRILRIEVEEKKWIKLKNSGINRIINKLKKLGYTYITLDLEGYVPAGQRQQLKI